MTVTSYVSLGVTATFSTLVGELLDVDPVSEKVDVVDVSHQGSTYKAFAAALIDAGEATLTIAYDPDNNVVPARGTKDYLLVTWPTGATNKFRAQCIFTGFAIAGKFGARIIATCTFKHTGAPNLVYT